MKLQWTGAMALAASAVAALAHSGASGVVLERMNGMTAMRDTVADLAPMMQGTVPYDTVAAPPPPAPDTPMAGMDHSQMGMTNEN